MHNWEKQAATDTGLCTYQLHIASAFPPGITSTPAARGATSSPACGGTCRGTRNAECLLNQRASGEIIVPGFGASDCRAHCGSHLRYLGCVACAGIDATKEEFQRCQ